MLPVLGLQQTAWSRPPSRPDLSVAPTRWLRAGKEQAPATTLQCDLGQFLPPSLHGNWALYSLQNPLSSLSKFTRAREVS